MNRQEKNRKIEKEIWTPENMKKTGLVEWKRPDSDVKIYFFNASYFSKMGKGNDIILSEEKDKELMKCVISFTKNSSSIKAKKGKVNLHVGRESDQVYKYVRKKLLESAGYDEMDLI